MLDTNIAEQHYQLGQKEKGTARGYQNVPFTETTRDI
jgi:hypothetical protein